MAALVWAGRAMARPAAYRNVLYRYVLSRFRHPDGVGHVTTNHLSLSCFVLSLCGDPCSSLGTAASRGRRARCPRPPRYGRAECGGRDITTGDSCTGTNGGIGGGRSGRYSNQLGGPVLSTRDDESGLHNV